jgi:nitrogen fixation protein NifU and related proteins
MSELSDLYQEVILDHNREPHNFYAMPGATRRAEGYNPLCGDQITVYLKLEGDKIKDVSFEGKGCAISKASASVMTDEIKGKTSLEADTLVEKFRELVTQPKEDQPSAEELGKLAVFAGVWEFPTRVKCATLAWHTLHSALAAKKGPITSE